jgi:hypothetical protein
MDSQRSHELMIFCDGGFGNRLNALASGLALAHHFNLNFCIYWPTNNWCQASFHDIFENDYPVSTLSIKDLKGSLNNSVMMLHDQIASDSLGVIFNSAYKYSSLEDFENLELNDPCTIFYYPALMPEWIPFPFIENELKSLVYINSIKNIVKEFIEKNFTNGFHGIHLRRTDLNVGLSDHEVMNLVRRYPQEQFFVCSDDPMAEELASAHPNVYARSKSSHVSKKFKDQDWFSKSLDDDGRMYYGNISRGKESVVEGVIDLLILAHSEIVGYSGSTFQRISKLIGDISPVIKIEKPKQLDYVSPNEVLRRLNNRMISANELISLCNKMGIQGDMQEAISILQKATAAFDGPAFCSLLHTLGVFFLNQNLPKVANIYLTEAINHDASNSSTWLYIAYAKFLMNHHQDASDAFNRANLCEPGSRSSQDSQLFEFLSKAALPNNN